jgi:hypothetical protein
MTDSHPKMCGFIRTAGVNIHATNADFTARYTEVLKRDGSRMISFNDNNCIDTVDNAKAKLYKCQNETCTRWCIIYTKSKSGKDKFHIIPDPRDKRNSGIYNFNYEESDDVEWSTYRLSNA